jgi:hypothetical protein
LFDHLCRLKNTNGSSKTTPTIVTSIPNERSQNSTLVPISSKLLGDEGKKTARIFKRLDVKRADSYDDWVKALIFLKSCGEEYKDIAREFSKKSPKYKEEEFEHKWNDVLPDPTSTPTGKNQLTLGTFISWAKDDHSFLDFSHFSSKCGCSLYKFIKKFDKQVICEDNMEEATQMLQKCVSRIFTGNEYIVRTKDDEVQTMEFNKFKQMMDTYTISWKENEQNTRSSSMYEWIHDHMLMYITYAYKAFRPIVGNYLGENGDPVFNPFRGFQFTRTSYILSEFDNGEDDCILGYMRKIVANNSVECFEYICDFIRHLLFEPDKPLGVSLVFIAPEGSGKNTFWEEFICGFLIGKHNSLTTEGTKRIASDFNSILENKLFVVVDEARVKAQDLATMKRLITGKDLEVHQKNKDLKLVPNHAAYVCLTNESKPFEELNRAQRRFCIMRMRGDYAGTEHEQYWTRLRKNILNQETANKFAQYLYDRPPKDLRKWPVTEVYQEMIAEQEDHVSIEYFEGEAFLVDFPSKKARSSNLLSKCNAWIFARHNDRKLQLTHSQMKKICVEKLKWKSSKTTFNSEGGVVVYEKPDEKPEETNISLESSEIHD